MRWFVMIAIFAVAGCADTPATRVDSPQNVDWANDILATEPMAGRGEPLATANNDVLLENPDALTAANDLTETRPAVVRDPFQPLPAADDQNVTDVDDVNTAGRRVFRRGWFRRR